MNYKTNCTANCDWATRWQILRLLILRQWYVLRGTIPDLLGDGLVAGCLYIIVLKYFLPAMGMDPAWQIPLFIGNMMMLCFTVGFQFGLKLTEDITHAKVMHYHLALALPTRWVLSTYVASFFFGFIALMIPIGLLGTILLATTQTFNGSLLASLLMWTVVLLFFSLLFATLGILYNQDQFLDHIWPRVLGPMFILGTMLFTWQRVHEFAPRVSYLFLFSPITYCVEGLRRAILGDPQFLPVGLCVAVVLSVSGFLIWLLSGAIRNRLDTVVVR